MKSTKEVGFHVSEPFHTVGAPWQTATWKSKQIRCLPVLGGYLLSEIAYGQGMNTKKSYVKPGRPGHKCIFDKLKPAGHRHRTCFFPQTSMHNRYGKG
jgi:hypothetical protein